MCRIKSSTVTELETVNIDNRLGETPDLPATINMIHTYVDGTEAQAPVIWEGRSLTLLGRKDVPG